MQTRSNPANKPNHNHHPIQRKNPRQNPHPPNKQQIQKTPPTYPFPAYSIVKEQNDGTKLPVAKRSRLAKTKPEGSALGGASV
jgi:hypothetical protein